MSEALSLLKSQVNAQKGPSWSCFLLLAPHNGITSEASNPVQDGAALSLLKSQVNAQKGSLWPCFLLQAPPKRDRERSEQSRARERQACLQAVRKCKAMVVALFLRTPPKRDRERNT